MKQASLNAPQGKHKPLHIKEEKTMQALRKEAGLLIEQVVDEEVECRWALVHWPVPVGERCFDESLNVAYQALWHFYSDDATLSQEAFYLDVQIQLLRRIAYHLQRNEDLPLELLMGYRLSPTDQAPRFYTTPSLQQQVMDSLAEFEQHLLEFQQLWQESFTFLKELLSEKTPSNGLAWLGSLWPKENSSFEDWRTLRQLRQHSNTVLPKEEAPQRMNRPIVSTFNSPFKTQPQKSLPTNNGFKPTVASTVSNMASSSGFSSARFQPISLKKS